MSPCQHFTFGKNLPCILTPKGSNEQSFFIGNNDKANKYHLCFIDNKADRWSSRSINQYVIDLVDVIIALSSDGKYYPCTSVEND